MRKHSRVLAALFAAALVAAPSLGGAEQTAPPFGLVDYDSSCPTGLLAGAAECTAAAEATQAGDVTMDLDIRSLGGGEGVGTGSVLAWGELSARYTTTAPVSGVTFDITLRINEARASRSGPVNSALGQVGASSFTGLEYSIELLAPSCEGCEADEATGTLLDAAGVEGPASISDVSFTIQLGVYTFEKAIPAGTPVFVRLRFDGVARISPVDKGAAALEFDLDVVNIDAATL